MSRKHKRHPALDERNEIDRLQLEAIIEVDEWQSRELKLQRDYEVTAGMKPGVAAAYLNSKSPHSRQRLRNRRHITTCLLPECDAPTIALMGTPLGVCHAHALDVAVYFDSMVDTSPFRDEITAKRTADVLFRIDAERKSAARVAESRRLHPGWIYYLLVADRIKIGFSKDVKRRLRAYPPDCPLLALHPGTKQLESEMHAKFAGSRAAGREWFLDTPELRGHIKQVIDEFGEPDRARYEHRGQHRDMRGLKAS